MKRSSEIHPQARRSFLKSVVAIAGGVAASSVRSGTTPKDDNAPTMAAKPEPEAGYRESEHIQRYYKTARL